MYRLISATILVLVFVISDVQPQGSLGLPPHLLFEFLRGIPRDPVMCNYACPIGSGATPSPRPGHVPRHNGCGSYGFEQMLIRDVEPFVECCNAHDICYDTCGVSKNVCDMRFQVCVNQRCGQRRDGGYAGGVSDFRHNMRAPPGTVLNTCASTARLLGTGPVLAGCAAYISAQSSACTCN